MIIDAHVHIFPDSVAPKAIANLQRHAPHPLATDGTLTGLQASMAKAGIDKSIILPVSTNPDQVPSINRYAVKLNQIQKDAPLYDCGDPAAPRTGISKSKSIATERDGHLIITPLRPIIAFGSLHPDFSNFRDEIKRLKDFGVKGVKMHPDYQNFDADEKKLFPLYEALAEAGLVLYLHAGENINIKEKPRCTPEKLANILKNFPQLKLIAAHLGGWNLWDETERFLVGSSIYLDTSFTLGYIKTEQFLRIVRSHGIEKIIFGSDSPWNDQKKSTNDILDLPLSREEKNSILGKNSASLFFLPFTM